MSAESQDWTASDLRQALIKKASDQSKIGAPPETLSAPTRQLAVTLADYVYYYDPSDPDVPDDIRDDKMYQLMMSRLETLTAHDAVRNGDVSSMRAVAGRQGQARTDARQKEWLDVVKALFKPDDRDHMLNLITYAPPPPEGPTGVGKTDFVYTLIDSALMFEDYEVATNNNSDPYTTITTFAEYKYWLRQVDKPKIAFFDELSQELMYSDQNEGKQLSNITKLGRKYNCHNLGIGHTGKDIPKDVRRMYMFALKESKKEAKIGAGLTEDQRGWMQIDNEIHLINQIPESTTSYESYDDTGDFSFDDDNIRKEFKQQFEDNVETCRIEDCDQTILDTQGLCKHHDPSDLDWGDVMYDIVQSNLEW